MQHVLNTYDPRTSWPGFLCTAGIVLTGLFWLLQPGASHGLRGLGLLGFWIVHVAIPLVLLQGAQLGLARVWPKLTPVMSILLSGLVAAVVFTPLALWLDVVFAVPEEPQDIARGPVGLAFSEFAGLAPSVILVWLVLNASRLLRLEPARTEALTQEATPEFWDRVPVELGRDLVALSAELHYLRVYTTRGDALVLSNFGRAVDALSDQVPGVQVHRSHWVAVSHVDSVQRRGQGATCVLSTGVVLPVSRARKQNLNSALTQTR